MKLRGRWLVIMSAWETTHRPAGVLLSSAVELVSLCLRSGIHAEKLSADRKKKGYEKEAQETCW